MQQPRHPQLAGNLHRVPTPACGFAIPSLWICITLLFLTAPGCAGLRTFAFRKDHGPYGPNTPCRLSKTPTVEEIASHINENADKIHGWRASGVSIQASGVPVRLSGNFFVEEKQRLRLEVTSMMGKEVDLGSNDEQFWLWMRPRGKMPPAVYYAAHENIDIARQNMPMPFEPGWLMEALGIRPMSTDNVQLEGEPGNAAIRLVSQHQMPDGQLIKKVVVVHGCHGYVMEHSTYDDRGQPIVRARLQDYRLDPESGAVLPHHVKLDWPQAEMSLAMDLGHIDVNPPSFPPTVWEMPQIPGSQMVDLGDPRLNGGQQYATRPRRPPPASTTIAAGPAAPVAAGSARPTVLATSQEEIDPFLPPSTFDDSRALPRPAPEFPTDDFGAPQVKWQTDSLPAGTLPAGTPRSSTIPPDSIDFQPPVAGDSGFQGDSTEAEEEAGRATVELLPAIEPF